MAELKMLKVIQPTESPPYPVAIKPPSKKIQVGLVQLNNSFSKQCYFPLSVGMLQAYAQKHLKYPEYYQFLLPLYTFLPIEEAVEQLSSADLLAASLYVWNFENIMAIIREFKRRYPERLVIVGGPHVPDSKKQFQRIKKADPKPDELKRKRVGMTEEFHRKYRDIDIAVHGEGERVFRYILEQYAIDGLRDRTNLPSISYIDPENKFYHNPRLERMHDLSNVPSPYLEGVFGPLMIAYPNQKWIAMWETDRGCPYQCTYCDWGGAIEDKVSPFPFKEHVTLEAEWFGINKIPYIFLANANYTILPIDVDIAKKLAQVKARYGYPQGISVQNAKNPKPRAFEALAILEEAGLNKATVMSIQSKNFETLKAVRRENMKPDEYKSIQARLRAKGVYTMTDYILGMPKETYDSFLNGIDEIISDGQHDRIQFNILSRLPNAEMGDPEYQEKYGMEIVRTAITNIHGKKNTSISGIEEMQDLVIATNTMPREDWVRSVTLCYMVALTYFDKLFQIPTIILHDVYGISYKDVFTTFMEKQQQSDQFPVFSEILNFFHSFAKGIQNGEHEEFFHSKEYLDILWPPDEYIFIRLCRENKLERFYVEAEKIMTGLIDSNVSTNPLLDALRLNRSLLKLPFITTNTAISLSYNVWDIYKAVRLEQNLSLDHGEYLYTIDRTTERWNSWEEWYEKMVWWSNRQGAYLYGNKNPIPDIEGHH